MNPQLHTSIARESLLATNKQMFESLFVCGPAWAESYIQEGTRNRGISGPIHVELEVAVGHQPVCSFGSTRSGQRSGLRGFNLNHNP